MTSSAASQGSTKFATGHKSIIPLTLCILLLSASQSVYAGDYLDELAVEAEATASIARQNKLSVTDKKEMREMESLLKEEKPSTYKYYVKLNKKNKVRAFEQFTSDQSDPKNRLSHLQKKVMDLYFEQ